ncbi:DUF4352 domain-containing protein [Haloechinothrix sp. YIM 98757]|uniref:DUF4352 domain-containing protein n=1 Tax=Haloechinothrix aidingensis TaxID=2752311 RepID=A0A838ADV9_9PSEU|nr:DUF4352 domain-containing protein [Haloechinothrix aidingensis]
MAEHTNPTDQRRRTLPWRHSLLNRSVASVALGLLGLIWVVAGASALVTVPLALAAVACGVLGWRSARQQRSTGRRDVAVFGAALGVLTLLSVTLTGTGGSETGDAGTDPARHGDTVRVGDVDVAVTDVGPAPEELPAPSGSDSSVYQVVSYELTNSTGSEQVFDKSVQSVYANGDRYSASTRGTSELNDSATMLTTVEPGVTIESKVAFELPETVTVTEVGLCDTVGKEWLVAVP